MNRSLIAMLAVTALTALTACSSAGAPSATTASDRPSSAAAAPAETETEAPAETAAAESSDPGAVSDAERQHCEGYLQTVFTDRGPHVATPEETASATEALGIELPGSPECAVVSDDADGEGTFTMFVWIGDESIAGTLADSLAAAGLTRSEEQASGYVIEVFTGPDVVASIAPVGTNNPMSVFGRGWPDVDVTMLGVSLP